MAHDRQEMETVVHRSLTDLYYLGQIIIFFRKSYHCKSFKELSELLFSILEIFGLRTTLFIRTQMHETCFFDDGINKNIEISLLDSLRNSKRILEFGTHRAAFNWKNTSLLVKNMPQDNILCGSMKDYLAFLMDGVEECIKKISIEMRLRDTAAHFKKQNENIKLAIVGLIEDSEEQLGKALAEAGVNDELSLQTEEKIMRIVKKTREHSDQKLQEGFALEAELASILALFELNGSHAISKAETDSIVDDSGLF